jgi:hypothetical protein
MDLARVAVQSPTVIFVFNQTFVLRNRQLLITTKPLATMVRDPENYINALTHFEHKQLHFGHTQIL